MTGSPRSSDGLDPRRRKLLFRSWHRGIREMDLIMGRFADACIGDLSGSELDDYERLIEMPDRELYSWVVGELGPPPDYDSTVLRKIRAFHRVQAEKN